jgi:uracil-DNA glycosylase
METGNTVLKGTMTERLERAKGLWAEVDSAVSPYPPGVVPVPQAIPGTAFFPGGLGLWLESEQSPQSAAQGRILVVGQDFNTVAAYNRVFEVGTEIKTSRTWRNLRSILFEAQLPLKSCVFTNFYMGLRENGPETGIFPGAKDSEFSDRCRKFFDHQVVIWQPRLIVTLGLPALRALSVICNLPTHACLRDCNRIFTNVPFGHGPVEIVALTHPSLYGANVGRRHYERLTGRQAEQSMIADAIAASGL